MPNQPRRASLFLRDERKDAPMISPVLIGSAKPSSSLRPVPRSSGVSDPGFAMERMRRAGLDPF